MINSSLTIRINELAQILQNSNVAEVSELAKGYLDLFERFNDLMNRHTRAMGELVLIKHAKVFKKLAESGD